MPSRKVVIIGTALFALVVFLSGVALMHRSAPPYMHGGTLNLNAAISYWRERIRAVGPQAAHDEMVMQGKNIGPQHNLAHTFGEALFDEGSLPYIKYCGAGEYLYGCYHQFIGLASLHFGSSILGTLKDTCGSSSTGCTHGIGHGLLSARDYTIPSLKTALGDCASIYDDRGDQGNCADGVFMEYNLQEMTTFYTGDIQPIARAFNEADAYSPCDTTSAFKNECIYELPLWWWFAIPPTASSTERSRSLGRLCAVMPDRMQREICELGLGFPIAQWEAFSPAAIRADCAAAAMGDEYVRCAAGAARRFYENGLLKPSTCTDLGLAGSGLSYCERVVSSPRMEMFTLPIDTTDKN